jgi:hypothetical protein
LNEGVVLDWTTGPPLLTSTSPRIVVGALDVAVLKMATTMIVALPDDKPADQIKRE